MSFDSAGLARAIAAHGALVRVVVAGAEGSTPREVGASMLVWAGGQSGSIGGGALEFAATEKAREILAAGREGALEKALLGPDMGQCCGGAVSLIYERFEAAPAPGAVFARPVPGAASAPAPAPPPSEALPILRKGWFFEPAQTAAAPVFIWGAGHVGRALAQALAPLPGIAATLVDTPARLAAPLPEGTGHRAAEDPAALAATLPRDARHYVMTHSHALDLALCDALLTHGFAALGLIGSATKWARFRSRLGQMGHGADAIARIRCPIGAPALGKQPESIALGVAYGLLMELAQKEA